MNAEDKTSIYYKDTKEADAKPILIDVWEQSDFEQRLELYLQRHMAYSAIGMSEEDQVKERMKCMDEEAAQRLWNDYKARKEAKKAERQRRQEQKQKNASEAVELPDKMPTMQYMYSGTIKGLDEYIKKIPRTPTFSDVVNRFMAEKNIKGPAEIARKGLMYESTLSKLLSGKDNINRDYLWSIAVAMRLDLNEAEELFSVCDKNMYAKHRLSKKNIEREWIIMFFIENKMYDIYRINEVLNNRNLPLLGNKMAKAK